MTVYPMYSYSKSSCVFFIFFAMAGILFVSSMVLIELAPDCSLRHLLFQVIATFELSYSEEKDRILQVG